MTMNKYEAYLDRGRVMVLDLDNRDIFRVEKHGRKIFSSETNAAGFGDDTCPYEVYRDAEGLLCMLNLTTGDVSPIVLVKV